jgi:hypothetical protein
MAVAGVERALREGTGPPGMGTSAMRTQRRQPTGSRRIMGLVFHRIERNHLHYCLRKAIIQQGEQEDSIPCSSSLAKSYLIHGEFLQPQLREGGHLCNEEAW